MRKLKGYIGALIVVMSLMGSILAGYALNINGTSAVINEYEKVTDVSGLYAHTDEKNYIEYNPASNYIGYGIVAETFTNDTGISTYRTVSNTNITITNSNLSVRIGSEPSNQIPLNYPGVIFVSDYFYIQTLNENGNYFISCYDKNIGKNKITNSITIEVGDLSTTKTIKLTVDGVSHTYSNCKLALCYTLSDYNYSNYFAEGGITKRVYVKSDQDVIAIGSGPRIIHGTTSYSVMSATTVTENTYINEGEIAEDVYRYLVGVNSSTILTIFYPTSIESISGLGIDYTESNRVNNYPVPFTNTIDTVIQTQTINLSNLSGITDYSMGSTPGSDYPVRMGTADKDGIFNNQGVQVTVRDIDYSMPDRMWGGTNVKIVNYKLSDILTAGAVVPQSTYLIKIDLSSNYSVVYDLYMENDVQNTFDLNLPCINDNNYVDYNNSISSSTAKVLNVNNKFGQKDYLLYDLTKGTVEIYSAAGTKLRTTTADNCFIATSKIPNGWNYTDNSTVLGTYIRGNDGNYGNYAYTRSNHTPSSPSASSNNYTTNITVSYYISSGEPQKYMDITKGINISAENIGSVTWNNEYENGDIKLVFRAENTANNYSNTFIVSGNNVAINYTGQRYYVSLNGGEAVDIGMWRSIVLDIDLTDGRLTAIPVRTFNSFSNVQLDSAHINIGNLVNAEPTTNIVWGATSNSLRFGVYSTEVFLNTYGVVMVNPSLDITNYFTDLNNFYRLKLFNFSILGDSITINGVEGSIAGDSITFDDGVYLKLKEMNITYADGRVSIQDSHTSIDLGAIASNIVSMEGIWYFQTDLLKGFTTSKMVYEWDWNGFIFDNVQFVVFYMGLAVAGLVIGRRYATMTVIDYVVWGISMIVAISVQVIG